MALDSGNDTVTYAEFAEAAEAVAVDLAELGIGPGDKVGVRLPSGTTDLYVAIMGSSSPARPTSPSTPTTPRSGPGWCSARRGSPR
nr:hypothetical protein [Nocardioides humi]